MDARGGEEGITSAEKVDGFPTPWDTTTACDFGEEGERMRFYLTLIEGLTSGSTPTAPGGQPQRS